MKRYLNWNRKSNNSTGKVILGAVAGMAVGLTAGLLTAPRPGKEIRNILSLRTNEALEKVGKTLAESKHQE
jgi:gas vesicle protein